MRCAAFKVGMGAPDDVSEAARLLDEGAFRAEEVVAILGKTEGNGGVNDYTRALATISFQRLIAERTGETIDQIARRAPIIWSGGTEGLMSPHATIFTRGPDLQPASGEKRLAVGVAYTREVLPEEFGRMPHVRVAAEGVRAAIRDAGISDPGDIHFVQIKTGALTTARIKEAQGRGRDTVTTDTYGSMGTARAVAALGIGLATGELSADRVSEEVIEHDFSVFSEVASTSSGVELMHCEVIVLGNSVASSSDLVMAHALMKDVLDAGSVREALQLAGLRVGCELATEDRGRLVNVFAKVEPDKSGRTRGRRHVMFEDSDINYTRH
ncbi:MAG: ring-opening amidohydrolase, partial [Chloroflexi bacterium]|nr:ring-opening amidohydrolase [Chloroflexota bacterium]